MKAPEKVEYFFSSSPPPSDCNARSAEKSEEERERERRGEKCTPGKGQSMRGGSEMGIARSQSTVATAKVAVTVR